MKWRLHIPCPERDKYKIVKAIESLINSQYKVRYNTVNRCWKYIRIIKGILAVDRMEPDIINNNLDDGDIQGKFVLDRYYKIYEFTVKEPVIFGNKVLVNLTIGKNTKIINLDKSIPVKKGLMVGKKPYPYVGDLNGF